MGNLYDINADFTFFNPNIKTPCTLSVNSEIVMQGFIQLRKIKKLINVDPQGNQIIYEVVIFNNAVDLMTELGEKTLNSLQLDELEHTYSFNNIVYSWTQSYTHGWVYPMYGLPNTQNQYFVTDFYPSYYSKYLLDAIFQEAGFGWTGSLKTNGQFEREILPFVGSGSQSISDEVLGRENIRVGVTQSFSESSLRPLPPSTSDVIIANPYTIGGGNPNTAFLINFTYSLPSDNYTNPFVSGQDFYDPSNDWNTTTSVWTTSTNRKWKPIWQLNYDVSWTNHNPEVVKVARYENQPGNTNTVLTDNFQFEITHYIEYKLPSTNTWLPWHSVLVRKSGWQRNTINWASGLTITDNVNFYDDTCPELFIPAGTQVRLRVNFNPSNGGSAAPFDKFVQLYKCFLATGPNTGGTGNGRKLTLTITYKPSPQNYFFSNGLVFDAQEGDPIRAKDWLSPKIKQKDFLNDLIKRYNLYIQVDPTNERLLILDTRPDFYNKVLNLDWTKKKDFSSEDEITLLAELQFKEMLFTMKSDNDEFNKDYTAKTGDILGQYKYTFGNEFVKGDKKIESPFSPTPLVKTAFNAVVPALSPQDPKVNPRVLYWGGLISTPYVNFTWLLKGTGQQQFYTQYPYAGHFDNPFAPTLDIHFGTPDYMYYSDYGVLPTDTMYETYWSDYVDSIEDGKLVKSKFYLDEYDIRLIKDNFWAKIFVLDSYYYVNKIIDYKPLENGVTQVELLKIKEGFAYKRKPGKTASIVRPIKDIKEKYPIADFGYGNATTIGINGGIVIGNNNVGGGKIIQGSFSFPSKQIILGDDNFLQGDNSGILGGKGNNVIGSGNWLIQSQNVNVEGNDLVVIGKREGTFSDTSSIYMGDNVKGDLTAKEGEYDAFSSTNLSINNFNLGQSDWRYVGEKDEVILQTGKQAIIEDISISGHYKVEGGTGTFSVGNSVLTKRGLSQIETTMNIDGVLSVYGDVSVGPPNLTGIGVFYSLQDQMATASTATQILLDTTNISQEVSINTNSQIVIDYPAAYRMSVTILLESLSGNVEDVIFWLKFNGVDYPYSGHFTSMPARKSAGIPSDTLFSYEFIGKSTSPNDYVELWWWTTSSDVKLKTRTVSGFPQSPSVVVNINKIA